MDLNNAIRTVNTWAQRKTIKDLEELDEPLFKQLTYINYPTMIAFVDFEAMDKTGNTTYAYYPDDATRKQVYEDSKRMVNEILPKLAEYVYVGMVVTYATIDDYGHLRGNYGITHRKVPAVTINYGTKMLKYPEHSPLEFHDLKEFARKVGAGGFLNDTVALNQVNDTAIIK